MSERMRFALVVAIVVALAVMPLVLSRVMAERRTSGTDEQAKQLVTAIAPGYRQWFAPFFRPQGVAEPILFGLQAAAGAGFIGYYLLRGRKRARVAASSTSRTAHDES